MNDFPERLSPMLASTADAPFDSVNHLFEIKWDGIRCLAFVTPDRKLILQSRNFHDLTAKFPELVGLADSCRPGNAIFDGELVVLNSQGKPDFSLIQRRIRANAATTITNYSRHFPATYMVFDLIYQNHQELFHLPLIQRKELLSLSLTEERLWVNTRAVEGRGIAYVSLVFGQGFEGVVAKDKFSPYLPGKRSEFWLKIKNRRQLAALIIGFTAATRASSINALILANETPDGQLTYIGRVGTGFSDQEGAKLLRALAKELVAKPIIAVPPGEKGSWWVKPSHRCRVEYLEFTNDGILRHPVYRGLIPDE